MSSKFSPFKRTTQNSDDDNFIDVCGTDENDENCPPPGSLNNTPKRRPMAKFGEVLSPNVKELKSDFKKQKQQPTESKALGLKINFTPSLVTLTERPAISVASSVIKPIATKPVLPTITTCNHNSVPAIVAPPNATDFSTPEQSSFLSNATTTTTTNTSRGDDDSDAGSDEDDDDADEEGSQKVAGKPPGVIGSRKEKSLGKLCNRFLLAVGLEARNGNDVNLETVKQKMCECFGRVEKRRIYDIVNVMEALEAMSKTNKGIYRWRGLAHLPQQMHALQNEALETDMPRQIMRVEQAMCSFVELSTGRPSSDLVGSLVTNDVASVSSSSNPPKTMQSQSQQLAQNQQLRDRNGKNSMVQLGRRFLMVLLCNPKDRRRVSLDVASTVLIKDPESEGFEPPSRSKCRRLYDIANVLVAMKLISKVHYLFGTKKIPLFVYCGPEPDADPSSARISMLEFLARSGLSRIDAEWQVAALGTLGFAQNAHPGQPSTSSQYQQHHQMMAHFNNNQPKPLTVPMKSSENSTEHLSRNDAKGAGIKRRRAVIGVSSIDNQIMASPSTTTIVPNTLQKDIPYPSANELKHVPKAKRPKISQSQMKREFDENTAPSLPKPRPILAHSFPNFFAGPYPIQGPTEPLQQGAHKMPFHNDWTHPRLNFPPPTMPCSTNPPNLAAPMSNYQNIVSNQLHQLGLLATAAFNEENMKLTAAAAKSHQPQHSVSSILGVSQKENIASNSCGDLTTISKPTNHFAFSSSSPKAFKPVNRQSIFRPRQ